MSLNSITDSCILLTGKTSDHHTPPLKIGEPRAFFNAQGYRSLEIVELMNQTPWNDIDTKTHTDSSRFYQTSYLDLRGRMHKHRVIVVLHSVWNLFGTSASQRLSSLDNFRPKIIENSFMWFAIACGYPIAFDRLICLCIDAVKNDIMVTDIMINGEAYNIKFVCAIAAYMCGPMGQIAYCFWARSY